VLATTALALSGGIAPAGSQVVNNFIQEIEVMTDLPAPPPKLAAPQPDSAAPAKPRTRNFVAPDPTARYDYPGGYAQRFDGIDKGKPARLKAPGAALKLK
jgi:hypothetical protein